MLDHNNLLMLVAIITIAIIFDFLNGFNDTANAIATCISTRALSLYNAIFMAAILNFFGAMVSTKVAATIGQGIIDANTINQMTILSGISGAVVWSLITWYFAIPSSSTHALIGGLIGATIAQVGISKVYWGGIKIIILAIIFAPIISIIFGFLSTIILIWIVYKQSPDKINKMFRKLQIISAAIMAFSHGTADAQKSMGIITMALVSYGYLNTFSVPFSVVIICATAISLGTAIGGWRIIKTIGSDFVKLQPMHGFCVQISASLVVLCSSFFGLPTSTTHITTSTIIGVGLSKNASAINWKIAQHILLSWILTIPISGIISFLLYLILNIVFIRIF